MDDLSGILQAATAAIGPGYFHLNIDGGDPVYRERVYCYELYHQMRSRWPDDCPYYLNGEIDKAAHPILTELGAAYAKPDFLVHTPGYMSGNHAIIEVKQALTSNAKIADDLDKLAVFQHKVGYRRAIYLVYGFEVDDTLLERIEVLAKKIELLPPVEVWFHSEPGMAAQHRLTMQHRGLRTKRRPVRSG